MSNPTRARVSRRAQLPNPPATAMSLFCMAIHAESAGQNDHRIKDFFLRARLHEPDGHVVAGEGRERRRAGEGNGGAVDLEAADGVAHEAELIAAGGRA